MKLWQRLPKAALILSLLYPTTVAAEVVVLTLRDNSIAFSGSFIGFDQDAYIIATENGELYVPAQHVNCSGSACIEIVRRAPHSTSISSESAGTPTNQISMSTRGTTPAIDQLLTLISRAEAPFHGYDSIHLNARSHTPKQPSQMTIAEILNWVDTTPGQPHAIGRYQFIPDTLRYVTRALQIPSSTVFDGSTQDRLAIYLINGAGYSEFMSNRLTMDDFMDNLAKVWAGLPLASGRSAYHGYAGNRATITRDEYSSAMASIFSTSSVSDSTY